MQLKQFYNIASKAEKVLQLLVIYLTDDEIMETLSVFLTLCEGNLPVNGGFISQMGRNVFPLLAWTAVEQRVELIAWNW